jgi:hypothetical protein
MRIWRVVLMASLTLTMATPQLAAQSSATPAMARECAKLYYMYGGADAPETRQMIAKAAAMNSRSEADMAADVSGMVDRSRRSIEEGRFDEADSRLVFNAVCQQDYGIARPAIRTIPQFQQAAATQAEAEKKAQIERIERLRAEGRLQPSGSAATTPAPAPTVSGASDAECTRIMNEGVDKATKDMMNARKWVQVWIKMGASGPALGGDYVRSGCNVINSTINRVNAAQCPADYANALERFRYNYYIGLPSGGQMNCN